MEQMEFLDNDDLVDDEYYDEEDDEDEDTDEDLDTDEEEDDDDANYIHVDSDLNKHNAVSKFDRYGEFVSKQI